MKKGMVFIVLFGWTLISFATISVVSQERGSSVDIDSVVPRNKYPTVFLPIWGQDTVLLETKEGALRLANDTIEEFFILFKLISHQHDKYKVIAYDGYESFIDSGYIYSTAPLRVYDRVYSDQDTLKFYEEPNRASNYKPYNRSHNNELEVLDFSNQWLYVRFQDNDTTLEGWLEPEQQCGNVWTTCN